LLLVGFGLVVPAPTLQTRGGCLLLTAGLGFSGVQGYNETKAAVRASLNQMGLQYLDLVMVHHRSADVNDWPRAQPVMKDLPAKQFPWMSVNASSNRALWGVPPCAQFANDPTGNWLQCQDQTWAALLELKKAGLVRAVGVSNWPIANLERMKRLGWELPAVNQVEPRPFSLSLSLRAACCLCWALQSWSCLLSAAHSTGFKTGESWTQTQ
jgi:diketogulonate reductase-like aldo/keto reductase